MRFPAETGGRHSKHMCSGSRAPLRRTGSAHLSACTCNFPARSTEVRVHLWLKPTSEQTHPVIYFMAQNDSCFWSSLIYLKTVQSDKMKGQVKLLKLFFKEVHQVQLPPLVQMHISQYPLSCSIWLICSSLENPAHTRFRKGWAQLGGRDGMAFDIL